MDEVLEVVEQQAWLLVFALNISKNYIKTVGDQTYLLALPLRFRSSA